MTIPRNTTYLQDPIAVALSALGWVLADDIRGERFLSLTGLTADDLRASLTDPGAQTEVLGAVLDFLSAYEPDMVAAADALAVPPSALVAARAALSGGEQP